MDDLVEDAEASWDAAEESVLARTSRQLAGTSAAGFEVVEAAQLHLASGNALADLLGEGEGEGTRIHVDGPLEVPQGNSVADGELGDAAALLEAAAAAEDVDEVVEGVVLEDADLLLHRRGLRLLEGVEVCLEEVVKEERRLRRRRRLSRRASRAKWPLSRSDGRGPRS